MENNRTGRRKPVYLIWLAASGFAAALAAGIAVGCNSWSAGGRGWLALPPAAVLVLTAILGIVRQSRARDIRRWRTALDAYADREIARDQRREAARTTASADVTWRRRTDQRQRPLNSALFTSRQATSKEITHEVSF
jgi:hypothetical protein